MTPNNQKSSERWKKEFDKSWKLYNWDKQAGNFTTCGEEVKSFISDLLKSQTQEILEEIDKVYKKEQGIHHWLDLKDKLKEKYANKQ